MDFKNSFTDDLGGAGGVKGGGRGKLGQKSHATSQIFKKFPYLSYFLMDFKNSFTNDLMGAGRGVRG